MSTPENDPKLAKADAQAAKARAKSLRPWFKKKRFIVPIILVVLIGFNTATGGNKGGNSSSSSSTSDESNSSSNTEEAKIAGIGTAAVDGDLSFTISDVSCGKTSLGDQYLSVDAQGQFCLVAVQVENIGKEPQTMFGSNQKVFDSEGREFSSDSTASFYLKDGSDTLWEEINPGNTLKGTLIFDVPAGVKLTKAELHESMFSSGVEVSLG
jgi:hypothetical protein